MAALMLFAAALGGGFLFPWWWPAVAAYAVGFWLPRRGASAFLSGFAGPAAAWAGLAAWYDFRNHHLLAGRIAALFHLPAGWLVVALTGILAGLMGGLGAWAGQALRAYVRPHSSGSGTAVGEAATAADGSAIVGASALADATVTGAITESPTPLPEGTPTEATDDIPPED
jgi:hypothetical protein